MMVVFNNLTAYFHVGEEGTQTPRCGISMTCLSYRSEHGNPTSIHYNPWWDEAVRIAPSKINQDKRGTYLDAILQVFVFRTI